MKIFVLDTDIELCARYHCDRHVNKMILESVQILCTVLNERGFNTPYQSTHRKHPCVSWVDLPDSYKVAGDAVAAYRAFYLGEKSRFARWTRRAAPGWWIPDAA